MQVSMHTSTCVSECVYVHMCGGCVWCMWCVCEHVCVSVEVCVHMYVSIHMWSVCVHIGQTSVVVLRCFHLGLSVP